jgi:hypothetical protein
MKIKSLHKIIPGERLKVCAYARISNDKEKLNLALMSKFPTTLLLF